MEIILCLLLIAGLLLLYWIFGKMAYSIAGAMPSNGCCLLTGVFVYHAFFQLEALPLICLKRPLSWLSVLWMLTILAVCIVFVIRWRKTDKRREQGEKREHGSPWLLILMAAFVLFQAYYVVTSEYIGWDTSYYVGTIGTSITTNSMYRFNGETGWKMSGLDFRYALSSFYMHAAVWCQVLPVRAIYYAKIVQGTVLVLLSNMLVWEFGCFLFSGKRYQGRLTGSQRKNGVAAMVIMAVIMNFYCKSIFTASDFLLNRALEAKGYCANFILPFLALAGLKMWRDSDKKETRLMLAAAGLGNVAISMSGIMTAPVSIVIFAVPVLFRDHRWKNWRLYLFCLLPNLLYLVIYFLNVKEIIRIGLI